MRIAVRNAGTSRRSRFWSEWSMSAWSSGASIRNRYVPLRTNIVIWSSRAISWTNDEPASGNSRKRVAENARMNQLKIYLPPPTNWQDFQSLVKDIAESRYDPSTVVEYGRQGQAQNGVDVYAEDRFGKKIGIQCKE